MVGSPPPTRGTQTVEGYDEDPGGITPAYAGNTILPTLFFFFFWDHPRLRGEHKDKNKGTTLAQGSPPPTRGTRYYLVKHYIYLGITPAYAGNTPISLAIFFVFKDHPRLRGEHFVVGFHIGFGRGSPPPTRGTRYCVYR